MPDQKRDTKPYTPVKPLNNSSNAQGTSDNSTNHHPVTSPPTPDRTHELLLGVLRAIESFYPTTELHDAIVLLGKNRDDGGALLKARGELKKLVEMVLNGVGGSGTKELSQVMMFLADMKKKVDALHDRATADDLGTFHNPMASVSRRYRDDHPEEKKAVTKYVADKFFPDDKIYAFIQASATAVYLAQELSKRTIRSGSLFYTNSAVVPLVLMQHLDGVSVYTVCGNDQDKNCGGWLPRMEDDDGRTHLVQLFNRPTDKLRDLFVTPIAVASDTGEVLFTRAELVKLLKGVVAPSQQVVIMTFSSRIHPNREAAQWAHMHQGLEGLDLLVPRDNPKPPQLVVSLDPNDGKSEAERKQVYKQLAAIGFDVHWQGVEKWDIEPAPQKRC